MLSEPGCKHAIQMKDVMYAIQDLALELHDTRQNLDALATKMDKSTRTDGGAPCSSIGQSDWNPTNDKGSEYTTWFYKVTGFCHDVWMSIIEKAKEELSHKPIEPIESTKEEIRMIMSTHAPEQNRYGSSQYDPLEDVMGVMPDSISNGVPFVVVTIVPCDDVEKVDHHYNYSIQEKVSRNNVILYGCIEKFEMSGSGFVLNNSEAIANDGLNFIPLVT
ncbi:unnamed protein product [Cuscuta campestris]|uniref:Uncharacterized protein n=1 Tax=Cuscuta campestris TaxID=132261 RepID=A0A484KII5_9ASTE|nr:unnamed protein product [Cuscuta campestris]